MGWWGGQPGLGCSCPVCLLIPPAPGCAPRGRRPGATHFRAGAFLFLAEKPWLHSVSVRHAVKVGEGGESLSLLGGWSRFCCQAAWSLGVLLWERSCQLRSPLTEGLVQLHDLRIRDQLLQGPQGWTGFRESVSTSQRGVCPFVQTDPPEGICRTGADPPAPSRMGSPPISQKQGLPSNSSLSLVHCSGLAGPPLARQWAISSPGVSAEKVDACSNWGGDPPAGQVACSS